MRSKFLQKEMKSVSCLA